MRRPVRFLPTLAALVSLAVAAPPRSASAAEIPVIIASIAAVSATPDDATSVLGFLRTYEATLASGRADRIVGLYQDFDRRRQGELQRYFDEVVRGLVVRLEEVEVEVDGDRALVAFDRTDTFEDRASGRRVEKSIWLERRLERDGGGWRMALEGP